MNKERGLISILCNVGLYLMTKVTSVSPTLHKNAESIEIGDNTDLEDTPLENIEQDIIHYDDEIGTLTIPNILRVQSKHFSFSYKLFLLFPYTHQHL